MKKLVMISVMLVLTVEVFAVPRLRIVKTLSMGWAHDYVWLNDHEILYSLMGALDGELRVLNIESGEDIQVISPEEGYESYRFFSGFQIQRDTAYVFLLVSKRNTSLLEPVFYTIESQELLPTEINETMPNEFLKESSFAEGCFLEASQEGLGLYRINLLRGKMRTQVLPWGQTREKELGDFDYYDDGFRYEISSMDGNDMLIAFDAESGGMTSYVTRLTEEGIEPLRPLRVKDNWPDFYMNYQAFYLADGNILYGRVAEKQEVRDPDAWYGPLTICDRAGNELYVFEDFQYMITSDIKVHLSPDKRYIIIDGYDMRKRPLQVRPHLLEVVYE